MSATRHVLTIFPVEDLTRAVGFYRSGFGWEQAVDTPVYAEFMLSGGMRFGLYEREGFGSNTGQIPVLTPPGGLAPTEIYFHVDDVQDAIERLRRAGGRELSALSPRDWGDEAAYFADPDGNVIVLARLSGTPDRSGG